MNGTFKASDIFLIINRLGLLIQSIYCGFIDMIGLRNWRGIAINQALLTSN